ncbi:hypothetical protein [Mucisphaera calidilacus]|uniref:Uncharacterized protein n=1 Tax=Mucisphaera calidilacus TaxID=2527982 RepID=A0A518BVP1_9BACT|nr:hypothetical protein [Mucisphaera calidilacus]QDU71042.1 hypothetical protein Pan265_08870 [Mucisphaera calidilacus]
MSLVIDIADAVTHELNLPARPGVFSKPFTAVRKLLPVYELADLVDLRVTVVPKAIESAAATRTLSQHDVSVDVGVQQKLVAQDADQQVEDLGTLTDEIAAYLRQRRLDQADHAMWVSTVNDPVYAADHLLHQRVFTSVLSLTYRTMRFR